MGYDIARLHAALNDLPAALLLASVLFDLLGAVNRRDSLRAAGFWCLVLGVLGGAAAVLTGRMAEGRVDHTDAAHAIMETHETLAYITLGLFGLLLAWRSLSKGVWGEKATPVALTAGVIGAALLIVTGRLGGKLVFDHALGIPTTRVESLVGERGGHVGPSPADSTAAPGDTAKAGGDSSRTHTHSDGSAHTH